MNQSNNIFRVRVCKHPIDRSEGSFESHDVLAQGQTIRDVKDAFCSGDRVFVVLNQREILEPTSAKVVSSGDLVDIVPLVGFFEPISTTAAIATMKFSFWATVTKIAITIAINVAIAFAVSYVGGKLFGQDLKERKEYTDSQNYSWDPRTTSREGLPRPRLYGELMVHGNAVATWTDVIDENEVLYTVIDHGEGPIVGLAGNDVYLNDQPSGNYEGVTIQERLGTMDQTCMTGFEKTKIEYPLNWELLKDEPQTFTTPNANFDDLEFTLSFPNGIVYYHKDGDQGALTVGMMAEISEHGEDDWTVCYNERITDSTRSAIFMNIKLSEVSPGFVVERGKQYDIRFTRLLTGEDTTRTSGRSFIKSVREVHNIAFTYPGRALIGVSALATEKISGSLDVKCVRKGRAVYVYDGENWDIQWSNNRAWVVLDLLTQPVFSGSGASGDPYTLVRYEGTDPSNVDLAFFYEWAQLCDVQVNDGKGGTEPFSVCNYIVDAKRKTGDLVHELAEVGRAKLYWEGSVYTGWLDAVANDVTDLITWDTILANSWKNGWVGPDELAGSVEAAYIDEDRGFKRTTYIHSNEQSGAYSRSISIEASGETRRSGAIRLTNFTLKRNQLLRNVNTFRQHKDAVRYKLGDVIRLQALTPDWGTHYRVVSVDSSLQTITVDRRVAGLAEDDLLYVRTFDDTSGVNDVNVTAYTVDSVSGKDIIVKEVLSPIPGKNAIAAAGTSQSAPVLRRIIKIVQGQDNYYDITVEPYNATLYSDISPNIPSPDYVWPSAIKKVAGPPRPITWQNIINLINSLIPPTPDITIPWVSNVTWSYESGGSMAWGPTDSDDPITFRLNGVTYEITTDSGGSSTTNKYAYWDPNDPNVFLTTDDPAVATAFGNWPLCIKEGTAVYPVVGIPLLHASLIIAGTIRTEHLEAKSVTTELLNDEAVGFAQTKPETWLNTEIQRVPQIAGITASWAESNYVAEYGVDDSDVTIAYAFYVKKNSPGTDVLDIRIRRDDTTVVYTRSQSIIDEWTELSGSVVDTPGEGIYRYDLDVKTTSDVGWIKMRRFLLTYES